MPILMNSWNDQILHTPILALKIMYMKAWLMVKKQFFKYNIFYGPWQIFLIWWTKWTRIHIQPDVQIHIKQKATFFHKNIPDVPCLCQIGENTCFMPKTFRRFKTNHAHHTLDWHYCSSSNQSCINGMCE